MRIGIDLDGVIFDSEKLYRIYSELYDIQDLKKNSLKNNKEIRFQDRYSWSDEETNGFVKKYHRKITEVSNFMPGAKDVISLLKEEGHTLIVITARGKLNKDLIPVTIQRLKDNNLDLFEKYYWGTDNKEEIKANIAKLQAEMMEAATNLQFERAAQLRDKIKELERKV
mgnify:CR=1 FL=1